MDTHEQAPITGRRAAVAPQEEPQPAPTSAQGEFNTRLLTALDDPAIVKALARRFAMIIDLRPDAFTRLSRIEDALKVHSADVAAERAARAQHSA